MAEFIGISNNECMFQGKVMEKPQIVEGQYAYLMLRTVESELGPNGQWVETPMDIPILTQDPNKISTIEKHVPAGRQIQVWGYYKAWENNGVKEHAFIIKRLKLGYKPREVSGAPALQ